MIVMENPTRLPDQRRGASFAVGNFDGLHPGHQALISAARAAAPLTGVLTFDPHPRAYFRPDRPPFRLSTNAAQQQLLAASGIDILARIRFDAALAATTARDFMDQILGDCLGAGHIVVGADFAFGRGRAGTTETLATWCQANAVGLTVMAEQTGPNGTPYRSSHVRSALSEGNLAGAQAILGRPYELIGRVIPGNRLARQLGFPTANLDIGTLARPRYGVYAVDVTILDDALAAVVRGGVANLGVRPTVDGIGEVFEVHVFDLDRDLYGCELLVRPRHFIRPEQKFAGIDALKAQIARDAVAARAWLVAAGASSVSHDVDSRTDAAKVNPRPAINTARANSFETDSF
jgi:riboflavin kinase/FMN adenylyltransferase